MSDEHGFAYRPALDGLRAVAVLGVVAYHLGWSATPGGFLGVDVFFVLSGYLITSLLVTERARTGRIALGAFWARRARRLLPAVLVVLTAVSVYALTWAPPERAQKLRGDGLAALFYVANWHLIGSGQSYFDLFTMPSPLRHMWSLAIEEQFYLLWPLLVAGVLATRGGRRWAGALCLAGAAVSATAMAMTYDAADPSRSYYGTDTRAHALLVGALLALLSDRRPSTARRAWAMEGLGLAGAATIVVAMLRVHDRDTLYYHGGSLLFAVAVAAVIAAAVTPARRPLRLVLGWRGLRAIGVISYGLYLWHWPVIVVLTRSRVGLDGAALDAVRVAATFVVAVVSYFAVERPIRYASFEDRRLLTLVPVSLLLVAALLSATTAISQEPPPAAFDASAPITAPPAPSTIPAASTTVPPDRGTPQTMAVVGDSVAVTLVWGLQEVAPDLGITVIPSSFPGCGIASGVPVDDHGRPFDWSDDCAANVPVIHEKLVAEHDPDLVVWLSTWELSDRLLDGHVVKYGTKEGDRALLASMEEAVRRLTAGGARLVMLTVAPPSESDYGPADEDRDGRYARYTRLMKETAAEHPDAVAVVDLAAIVCPGGPPCPDKVEGIRLRPDGRHFTEATSPWAAARVLPLIVEAYRLSPS